MAREGEDGGDEKAGERGLGSESGVERIKQIGRKTKNSFWKTRKKSGAGGLTPPCGAGACSGRTGAMGSPERLLRRHGMGSIGTAVGFQYQMTALAKASLLSVGPTVGMAGRSLPC